MQFPSRSEVRGASKQPSWVQFEDRGLTENSAAKSTWGGSWELRKLIIRTL